VTAHINPDTRSEAGARISSDADAHVSTADEDRAQAHGNTPATVGDGIAMLALDKVTKDYRGQRALDEVSFVLQPGVVALLGPNGAGKSTLIKTLLGLVRLDSGTATVLGYDSRADFRKVREIVGYMPEDDCIFPGLQGIEAVAYAAQLSGLPRLAALRRAHEVLDYVGLGEERYREVQTYSTGMRQKQKFAQAIVHDPKLVFLDEPTSGLDPIGRRRMLKLIKALYVRTGIGVVLSTHILQDVQEVCDSVLIIGHGKLLVHDTLEALQRPSDESIVIGLEQRDPSFEAALDQRGARWETLSAGEMRLYGEPQAAAALTFEVAHETGAVVRRIEAGHNTLEAIFLDAVRGDK
jgi:ABC-2 type transport system ATP-binding protein